MKRINYVIMEGQTMTAGASADTETHPRHIGRQPEICDIDRHNGNVNNGQRRSLDDIKLPNQGSTSPNVTVQ
jgi:hypothetical protein